jgi:hypothetical protein
MARIYSGFSRGFRLEIHLKDIGKVFESEICFNIVNGDQVHFLEEEIEIGLPLTNLTITFLFFELFIDAFPTDDTTLVSE